MDLEEDNNVQLLHRQDHDTNEVPQEFLERLLIEENELENALLQQQQVRAVKSKIASATSSAVAVRTSYNGRSVKMNRYSSNEDDDGEEEERLLAQLKRDASILSPAKPFMTMLARLASSPGGSIKGDEKDDDEEGYDTETELLTRALFEEHQAKQILLPMGGDNTASSWKDKDKTQLDQSHEANPDDRLIHNEDDNKEEQLLLEILKKASAEAGEFRKKSSSAEVLWLQNRIAQLQSELVKERAKTEAALTRAADLYAQRFALAMVCAASVPPLGLALLAHRYNLHDYETFSDAIGVFLVAIVVLMFAAYSLWRRARAELAMSPSSLTEFNTRPSRKKNRESVKLENNLGAQAEVAAGLRKRKSRVQAAFDGTKAELML
jgi:hypothetical protein